MWSQWWLINYNDNANYEVLHPKIAKPSCFMFSGLTEIFMPRYWYTLLLIAQRYRYSWRYLLRRYLRSSIIQVPYGRIATWIWQINGPDYSMYYIGFTPGFVYILVFNLSVSTKMAKTKLLLFFSIHLAHFKKAARRKAYSLILSCSLYYFLRVKQR